MSFEVPIRVTEPIDRETLSKQYNNGDFNRVKPPLERGTLNQASVNKTYPSNNNASYQNNRCVNNPVPNRTNSNNSQAYNQSHSNNSQNSASTKALPPRKRTPNVSTSTELMRGQKWTVADKTGRIPASIKVCVGWDILDSRCELDASAFMLGDNDKVPSDDWFIFYGQTNSPDRGVQYSSNADNRNAPDDAELYVQLNKIQPQINKIAVCVTIYEAASKRLHFGMVKNLYARILDESGSEIAKFLLKDCSDQVNAMVVGELYRYKGSWKFNAVGSGVKRDLSEFCAMYGVNLE